MEAATGVSCFSSLELSSVWCWAHWKHVWDVIDALFCMLGYFQSGVEATLCYHLKVNRFPDRVPSQTHIYIFIWILILKSSVQFSEPSKVERINQYLPTRLFYQLISRLGILIPCKKCVKSVFPSVKNDYPVIHYVTLKSILTLADLRNVTSPL